MCSNYDSDATYCSEVEEFLKATSTNKCSVVKVSSPPLRRSQRILEKSNAKFVDRNEFCLDDFVCHERANNRPANKLSKNGVKTTKVSQEIFSIQDLREDQQALYNEVISNQTKEHTSNGNLKSQLELPLDLSKKSIKQTFATSLHKESKQQPIYWDKKTTQKGYSKVDSKQLSTQVINSKDYDNKNVKNKKLDRHKKICQIRHSIRKNPKSFNKNLTNNDLNNCLPLFKESKITCEDTVLKNTNCSSTLKIDTEPLIVNTICETVKENVAIAETVTTNELKINKRNTLSVLDNSLKTCDISPSNKSKLMSKKKELNLNKCLTFKENDINKLSTESTISYNPPSNEIIAIENDNASTTITNNDKSNTLTKTNKTRKKSQTEAKFCKRTHATISRNGKITASKTKGVQNTTMCKQKLKLSEENMVSVDNKRNIFGNVRSLDDSEKSLIEKNYRKTLFRINSEEVLPKTKPWGKLGYRRKLSLSQSATVPTKQVKRSMPSTEFFKSCASSQNPLTPLTQFTQDELSKTILREIYPSHFEDQLPSETPCNRAVPTQPTYVITPDDTPSAELLDSSSSSPSLPESLCELLQTKDIKDILNVDKVTYRLFDYHIEALALILNLSQEYLRNVLDKIINIRPSVLKNINKAVKEPFVTDEELFTITPAESLSSEDVVFNSQESKAIRSVHMQ